MKVNITEACRPLFARPSTTPVNPVGRSSDGNTENKNSDPRLPPGPMQDQCTGGPDGKQRSKRRMTDDVTVMVRESFVCCKSMRCVEKFVTGEADINELRRQQKDFSQLESRKGRARWIGNLVPSTKQGKNQGSMKAGNIYVCNQFFCSAFGVSKCSIDSAKKNPCSFTRKTQNQEQRDLSSKTGRRILAYLDWYAEHCGQHMPHEDATYLYVDTKKELFKECQRNFCKLYGPSVVCSKPYFYKVWKEHRPTIQPRAGGEFVKCSQCMLFGATLLRPPGVRVGADDAVVKRTAKDRERHLGLVNKDRDRIATIESDALRSIQDMNPLRKVSIFADAACQTTFSLPAMPPQCLDRHHEGCSETQKVFCVFSPGNFVQFFLAPQTVGGGINLICTAIHLALTRIFETHVNKVDKAYIEELFVQVDNCVGENDNQVLVGYLGSLVGRGIIGRVEINFMMVGHVHIKIDQIFSRVSSRFKGRTVFTREQQASVFKAAYEDLPVHVITLRSLGNFEAALVGTDCVRKIPGIQRPRSFELKKKKNMEPDAVTVGMKEHMHNPQYSGLTEAGVFEGAAPLLFKGGIPAVENAPPFELKNVDPEVIRLTKMRHKAVHPRVDALFPRDKKKQDRIKAEMDCSANLLSATGSYEFDLPTWWLPDRDGTDDEGGDEGESGSGDSEDTETDWENDELGSTFRETVGSEEDKGGDGVRVEGYQVDDSSDDEGEDHRVLPTAGNIVFFASALAPFIVAQLIGTCTTQEGVREVHVHWWSPRNETVRDNASQYSIVEYGNHAFAADYYVHVEETTASGGKKRRRVADTGWEAASSMVTSCEKLRADKTIPKGVLKRLIVAHLTMSNQTSGRQG